jgi:murein L,D-transpeptidase YcbB/YkuD
MGMVQESFAKRESMKPQTLGYMASAALIAGLPATASAQIATPVPAQSASLPTASAVAAVYDQWKMKPIWFQGSIPSPAAARLIEILRRAPFDGLAAGPAIAAQVNAAIAQAASGNPAAIIAAERTLSAAWVHYVQTLKRPTRGMIYAYKFMEPQGLRADQILLIAGGVPSLERHLQQVSNLNPVYAQLRAAAIAEAQATGNMVPDPRLIANLDRARSIPSGGKFALVDVATQRLWMYENGVPVDSMKVIVGTNEQPTPMIASVIHYVTFNPYWNAPDNLVRKAIAPNAVSQGQKYLKSRGYEVMSDWTDNAAVVPADQVDWKAVAAGRQKIRVRQLPGGGNFMGNFKFSFPNGQDIFLHDTPAKELFAKSSRDLSNGCVRLEDAEKFARWLLGRDPVAPSADAETHVQMAQGVPIVLTYLTAQPADGKVAYAADIYGWDRSPELAVAAAHMVSRE